MVKSATEGQIQGPNPLPGADFRDATLSQGQIQGRNPLRMVRPENLQPNDSCSTLDASRVASSTPPVVINLFNSHARSLSCCMRQAFPQGARQHTCVAHDNSARLTWDSDACGVRACALSLLVIQSLISISVLQR